MLTAGGILLLVRQIAQAPFARALAVYFASTVGLTICWGILQTGPLYSFNSHFNFALLFIPMVLLAIGLSKLLDEKAPPWLPAAMCVAAVPLFALTAQSWRFDGGMLDARANLGYFPNLAPAALVDGKRTKYLAFPHDYWWWATSIALALERMGRDYAVPPDEAFMFGHRHVRDLGASVAKGMPVWWGGDSRAKPPGFSLPGGQFIATTSAALGELPVELRFAMSDPKTLAIAIIGWDFSDAAVTWSVAPMGALYFRHGTVTRDVEMIINVSPAVSAKLPEQRLVISFNASPIQTFTCSHAERLTVRIPAEAWNRSSVGLLVFNFPDAASPQQLGLSDDTRRLGYAFDSIQIAETAAPAPPVTAGR